jgi:hypothetical protein
MLAVDDPSKRSTKNNNKNNNKIKKEAVKSDQGWHVSLLNLIMT